MADLSYTLAVWSVFDSRWMPLATAPAERVELLRQLAIQFSAFVSWPHAVIELPGGSDEDVIAACRELPAPAEFDWEAVYRDVHDSIGDARFHDAVHPPGDPNR